MQCDRLFCSGLEGGNGYRLMTHSRPVREKQDGISDEAFLGVSLQLQRLGVKLHGTLRPTLKIEYTRLRFIDPLTGVRLCVDYDIRAAACNPKMFGSTRPYPPRSGVFELKGRSGQLPDWLHQLTAFDCRRAAFSKYSACWQQVTNQPF